MKVFIKTPFTFMGPQGAPKIPQSFFHGRNPPAQKQDNTSERVKEFLCNKRKFKNPESSKKEPPGGMLDFIKEKVKERESTKT